MAYGVSTDCLTSGACLAPPSLPVYRLPTTVYFSAYCALATAFAGGGSDSFGSEIFLNISRRSGRMNENR